MTTGEWTNDYIKNHYKTKKEDGTFTREDLWYVCGVGTQVMYDKAIEEFKNFIYEVVGPEYKMTKEEIEYYIKDYSNKILNLEKL